MNSHSKEILAFWGLYDKVSFFQKKKNLQNKQPSMEEKETDTNFNLLRLYSKKKKYSSDFFLVFIF
jgi:hypothetical protein